MIILGIDPGYAIVGFGVLNKEGSSVTMVDNGVITTDKTDSFPKRLSIIAEKVKELIIKYKPQAVAVEELFFHTNQKTAITVAQARGVLIYIAESLGVELYEYTPLQVKQALTGYGRADKKQMQQMVKTFLKLKECPKPDDAADALAVALTHARTSPLLLRTTRLN
ncbi:MAG: crossover junction endodeoxyribonuclease RuvC [Firmicutes bacterium]|nr:crossover junction endodeoxyribonuclease RuvC [Bacillota bacterium]